MHKILVGMYGSFEGNNLIFIIVSFVVLFAVSIYAHKTRKESKLKSVLWQLIIAGGLSNVIDRIFRGYVVDFIQMKLFGIYNIADALIVVSVAIIMFIEIKEIVSGNTKSKSN